MKFDFYLDNDADLSLSLLRKLTRPAPGVRVHGKITVLVPMAFGAVVDRLPNFVPAAQCANNVLEWVEDHTALGAVEQFVLYSPDPAFVVEKDEPTCWLAKARKQSGLVKALGPMCVALAKRGLDPLAVNFTLLLPNDPSKLDPLAQAGYLGFVKAEQ